MLDLSISTSFASPLRAHWALVLLTSSLLYLVLVRNLRWGRYTQIHQMYQRKYTLTGSLTPEEAQQVIEVCLSYDMPMLMRYSLSLALFKTYGIPSISKILRGTREMGSRESISKRFADTEILISTVIACPISGKIGSLSSTNNNSNTTAINAINATTTDPNSNLYQHGHPELTAKHLSSAQPNSNSNHMVTDVKSDSESSSPWTKIDDPRAMIAIARVNWLHAKYPIKNEDNLYTLSLAIFEPERWAKRYGWRELSALECHAFYIFWTEIGRRMGIKDIPETAEDFKEWSLNYQQSTMKPSQSNYDVANITLGEFISILPNRFGIRNFAKGIAISLLEDIVREAMIFDPQPSYMKTIIESLLRSISFIQLHLCLPRSSPTGPVDSNLPGFATSGQIHGGKCPYGGHPLAHAHTPEFMESGGKSDVSSTGGSLTSSHMHTQEHLEARMHPNSYQRRPWYRPEGQGILGKWGDKMNVWMGVWEQMPSKELRSGGYRLEEMGPLRYEQQGHEEVIHEAERLLGGPITGPWVAY